MVWAEQLAPSGSATMAPLTRAPGCWGCFALSDLVGAPCHLDVHPGHLSSLSAPHPSAVLTLPDLLEIPRSSHLWALGSPPTRVAACVASLQLQPLSLLLSPPLPGAP